MPPKLTEIVEEFATAPREVVLVDTLPLLPGGKLDREALRRAAGSAG